MSAKEEANRQAQDRLEARREHRECNLERLDRLEKGDDVDLTEIDTAERIAVRAEQLGIDVPVVESRAALDVPAAHQRVLEQILGANDLLDVTFLSEGARVADAVGRVTMPVNGGLRLGTGFMVSPRVLMTNNHVLETVAQADLASIEFDYFRRETGTIGPIVTFGLRPDLLFLTDAALDFTLVAVRSHTTAGDAVADRGFVPLIGPSGKAIVGERVSIIQHPGGDPQKVAVYANRVTDVDPDDDFLHYQTDTMGGSSGSPVFNTTWDLAALHHAAIGTNNEGIRISSIVDHLLQLTGNESASNNEYLTEVLNPGTVTDDGTTPPPVKPTLGEPQVNSDGTVSWTIPLSVTLGLGHDPQVTTPTPPVASTATGDGGLTTALTALTTAEDRVYYSKANDDEAIALYYPECLDTLDPGALYDTLSQLTSSTHHTTLSYRSARLEHLYPWIDRRDGPDRALRGIYSNQVFDPETVIRQEVAAEVARQEAIEQRLRFESTGDIDEAFLEQLETQHPFNCEHVVPQSWFNRRNQPKADLHHLFTCEWGCNSFRGNRAYFNFDDEAYREGCGQSGNGRFEPNAGKGAVARATLYFLVRYPGDVADSSSEMSIDRLDTIVGWANNDKVDRWERHRNAEIAKLQGNRNPFIDFPDLVDAVDFSRGLA